MSSIHEIAKEAAVLAAVVSRNPNPQ